VLFRSGGPNPGDRPNAPMMAAQVSVAENIAPETILTAPEITGVPERVVETAPAGPRIDSLAEIVALAGDAREPILAAWLKNDVHLIGITPGQLEISGANNPPKDLLNRLRECLFGWTDRRWLIVISDAPGEPTLAEQAAKVEAAAHQRLVDDPLVSQILKMFPGAEIRSVRTRHDQSSGDDEI